MTYNAKEFARAYMNFIKYFGWNEWAYINQDVSDLNEIYENFHYDAPYQNLHIYDRPDLNGFSIFANYTSFSEGNGQKLLDLVFESETRIILVNLPVGGFGYDFLEYLYDQGYRRGDFVFIISLAINSLNEIKDTEPERWAKIAEFAYNSLVVI